MKNLHTLDKYRDTQTERDYYHRRGDSGNGAFKVYINGRLFFCVASNGGGWEHVSVSPCNRKRATPPTWAEMCEIKHMTACTSGVQHLRRCPDRPENLCEWRLNKWTIKRESLCSVKLNETRNRFGFGLLGLDTKGREKNSESSVTEKRLWNQQQKSSKKNTESTLLVGAPVAPSLSTEAGLD